METVRYSGWAADPSSWSSYERELYSFQLDVRRRYRRMQLLAALFLLPCDLLAFVGAYLSASSWGGLIVLAMVVLMWGPILNAKSKRILRETPAYLPLDYCADWIPNFPVRIKVMQGLAVTGADEGIVWVQSGILHFVGRFTSFAVPGGMFRARKLTTLEKGTLGMGGLACEFDALPNGLPLWVWMEQSAGVTSLSEQSQLGSALTSWPIGEPGPTDCQFPPTDIGPGAWLPGRCGSSLLRSGVYALGLSLLVAGWRLWAISSTGDTSMFAMLALGLAALVLFALVLLRHILGTARSLGDSRRVRRRDHVPTTGTLGPELQVELSVGTEAAV